jgi:hypothetical protein
LRQRRKRFASFLKRRGFVFAVRPSIGKSLANDAFRQLLGAALIIDTKRDAI